MSSDPLPLDDSLFPQPVADELLDVPPGDLPTIRPRFSLFAKVLVGTLLVVGATTVSLAYAAPEILEPIVSNLPTGLIPGDSAAGCST